MSKSSTRTIYFERINKVLAYIDQHLGDELRLEDLAAMAFFSFYHFHKIMRAYLREPIGSYIIRVRRMRPFHCCYIPLRPFQTLPSALAMTPRLLSPRLFRNVSVRRPATIVRIRDP